MTLAAGASNRSLREDQALDWFNVSSDGDWIYTLRALVESDIWMAELK